MKHIKLKKFSFISVGLLSSLFLLFGISYSLSSAFNKNENLQTSLTKQSEIKNQADSTTSPLDNLNIGANNTTGTALSNKPIILSDGSYVVTTNSGLSKVSPFGSVLYSYSFTNLPSDSNTASFASYQSRQVVQNYLQPNIFYLLIYSSNLSINASSLSNVTITNPGYVLTLQDTGNGFSYLKKTALTLPNLTSISFAKFYATLVTPNTTDSNFVTMNTSAASNSKSFTDKWTAPSDGSKAPGINYDKTVLENLYLNNLNNMVYIDNNIFIFGGNNLPSFWFYAFKTNDEEAVDISSTAKLYMSTNVTLPSNFQNIRPWFNNSRTTNYPAFFVTGATTLAQSCYDNGVVVGTSYTVQAAFEGVGRIDYNAGNTSTKNMQSVYLNTSYFYTTTDGTTYYTSDKRDYYFLASMNNQTASALAAGTSTKLFDTSTNGFHALTLTFSSSNKPDGYVNNSSDRLYAFDIQAIPPASGNGLSAINALLIFRDSIARIIYNPNTFLPLTYTNNNGQFIDDKSYSIFLTARNVLDQSNLKQIVFNNNSWYLLTSDFNNTTSRVVSVNTSGSFLPAPTTNAPLVPPSSINLEFTSITAPSGSKVTGLLPVSDNFIYGIITNASNNVSLDLFNRSDINSPFQKDESYVYSGSGLPTYEPNSSIWGTITIRDSTYLNNAGYFSQSANEIANDPNKLQNLISFTPAWPGQTATVSSGTITDQTVLPVVFSVKYFNGQMYNNHSFQNSLGFPDFSLTGLSGLPSWVVPVAVGVSVGLGAIILILGLSIGIPMAKNRKLQDKGFAHTYKKVDTLTSAVGSVYKKIITQTAAVKKKPQMLKSATAKPTVKKPGDSLTSNSVKPASPVKPPLANKPVSANAPAKQTPPIKPSAPVKK